MASRGLVLTLLTFTLLVAVAVADAAGQRSCDLTSSRSFRSNQTNQARVSYVAAPRFVCSDGTRIEADSSVTFEASSFTQLFGTVVFRDERRELFADRAQYFSGVGRLQAQGSVLLTNLESGSSVSGDDLVLLQAGRDRDEDDVTVRQGRPHARLVSTPIPDSLTRADSLGTRETADAGEPVPYEVDANLIHLVGERLFQARGQVEITRESLQSFGDSVEFQQDIGRVTLFENARVISQDSVSGDTMDVRGDTITMNVPSDRIDEMESRGRAQLLANQVDMRGPVIRLLFMDEKLERVFAVQRDGNGSGDAPPASAGDSTGFPLPPSQPLAVAEDFRLTGDSIEANLVDGGLDRVIATGRARGVSTARDSLNTAETDELIRSDWIQGDTITARFRAGSQLVTESGLVGPEPPMNRDRQLEQLIARGDARAFYRSAPDSIAGANRPPKALELNYVIGEEVRLFMRDGEVDRMEVDNPTGVYLQPRPLAAPSRAVPDTTAIPDMPGAAGQPPDGGRVRGANGGNR